MRGTHTRSQTRPSADLVCARVAASACTRRHAVCACSRVRVRACVRVHECVCVRCALTRRSPPAAGRSPPAGGPAPRAPAVSIGTAAAAAPLQRLRGSMPSGAASLAQGRLPVSGVPDPGGIPTSGAEPLCAREERRRRPAAPPGSPGGNHASVPGPGELSGRPAGGLQRGNCPSHCPAPLPQRLPPHPGTSPSALTPARTPEPSAIRMQGPRSALVGGCRPDREPREITGAACFQPRWALPSPGGQPEPRGQDHRPGGRLLPAEAASALPRDSPRGNSRVYGRSATLCQELTGERRERWVALHW